MSSVIKDLSPSSQRTIAIVENELAYSYVRKIGIGKFGDVVSLRNKDGHLRAGMIVSKVDKKAYLDIWPKRDNENLLKLEKIIFVPTVPSYCFVTENYFTSLDVMFELPVFQEDACNIVDLKRWLISIFRGLQYLHKKSLCHLNITGSSILISCNSKARIGGFSHVRPSTEPVTR